MSLATQDVTDGVVIDRAAVLQALPLNPRDPTVQALVLVCQPYGLDPVLKHAVLISGNLYVTRDGLLAVAHRSGDLDGIVVEEEGESADEWWAKVSVHVKGQKHPYTYRGRYPKSGHQKKYGPEMAVKCAEVMALRRAFGITGIATVEEQWDKHDGAIAADVVNPPSPEDPLADAGPLTAAMDEIADRHERAQAKQQFVAQFGLPQNLRQSQWDDAEAWVAAVAAGPSGGGEPAGQTLVAGNPAGESKDPTVPANLSLAPSELSGAGDGTVSNGGTDTASSGGAVGVPASVESIPCAGCGHPNGRHTAYWDVPDSDAIPGGAGGLACTECEDCDDFVHEGDR